ncbi:hypothetical protein M231_03636 [Tremella mesenterica]|uniref:C3H1-type domain-containing protein n=2 Tax=Tremella mesenterica TaxID=5217 RepID=A0A4Q1BMR0_TREME|nr:hypothetical protein M231_03636 [Tremella mesenterica]
MENRPGGTGGGGFVSMHEIQPLDVSRSLPGLPTVFNPDPRITPLPHTDNKPDVSIPPYVFALSFLPSSSFASYAVPTAQVNGIDNTINAESGPSRDLEVKEGSPFTFRPPSSSPGPTSNFALQPRSELHRAASAITQSAPIRQDTQGKDSSTIDKLPVKRPAEDDGSRATKQRGTVPTKAPPSTSQGMALIRPLISSTSLKSSKPAVLFKYLRPRIKGPEVLPPEFEPNARELREILLALKDHAPEQYLRNMADNERYAKTLAIWLKMFIDDVEKWESAIAPLLLMLSRTDMAVDVMVKYGFGKSCKIVNTRAAKKDLKSAGEIRKAFERYHSWCQEKLLPGGRKALEDSESDQGGTKKQKMNDGTAQASSSGPTKSTANTTSTTKPNSTAIIKPAVKKEATKSDMSFFSATTPASSTVKKRVIPDIKKIDRSAAPSTGAPTTSLLSTTMNQLLKKAQSPPPSAVEVAGSGDLGAGSGKKQPNKKGHMVRFKDLIPDGGALESIRVFREEPHELEPAPWGNTNEAHGKSVHQLDMSEGLALRAHGVDEQIDWYDPEQYFDPAIHRETPFTSSENEIQETRERGILAVTYMSDAQIPSDPSEIGVKIAEKAMSTRLLYPSQAPQPSQTSTMIPDISTTQSSVSDLLKKIILPPNLLQPQPLPPPLSQPQQPLVAPIYGGFYNPPAPQDYPPIRTAQSQNHYPQATPSYPSASVWSAPQSQTHEYGARDDHRGRRGSARERREARDARDEPSNGGRHRSKICKFWVEGRCDQGDRCRNRHGSE